MKYYLKSIAVVAVVILLALFVFVPREDSRLFVPGKGKTSQKAEFIRAVKEQSSKLETASVVEILDGDSFIIANGEEVRLIGIDAPELSQPYAEESKNFLTGLILGKKVRLERDKTNTDRYGRLLRYVYLDDMFINLEMVRWGYANIYSYPPDTKHEKEIIDAEREAKEAKRGFWEESKITSE